MFHFPVLLITLAGIALPQPPARENAWPCFLGANRNGISAETGLNVDWNKKPPKILWKAPLGKGFSSLAIVQGKIYTMAERNKRQLVVRFAADTGKELWRRDLAPGYLDFQDLALHRAPRRPFTTANSTVCFRSANCFA